MNINIDSYGSDYKNVLVEDICSDGKAIDIDSYGSDFKNIIIEDISSDGKVVEINRSGGQSMNHDDLYNLPTIEGVTLKGDKTFEELNLLSLTNSEIEALLQ